MSAPVDSELFQALVLQLGQAGWMALGKIPNPMSREMDRNLAIARLTIDTLGALETRTRGNLSDDERALLERTLRELRLNYVDEVKKGEGSTAPPPEAAAAEGAGPPPAGESTPAGREDQGLESGA